LIGAEFFSVPEPARRVILVRALRSFGDGFMSLVVPVYLSSLGLDATAVGAGATATLLGSSALTFLAGASAHRLGRRPLLLAASLAMTATGIGFAGFENFWPLLLVAILGTFNPSAADMSVFLPLEQSLLGDAADPKRRTDTFALFSLMAALALALGSLAAGALDWFGPAYGTAAVSRGFFVFYAALGAAAFLIYRRLPESRPGPGATATAALGPSRQRVYRLAALFSLDSFGGGLVLRSLLALWLFERFGLSVAATGAVFFWAGLLQAASFPLSAWLARRIGLVNTMVFTHLPASLLLIAIPFMPNAGLVVGLLIARSLFTTMDVPARHSYVMAVVSAPERPAAASFAAVARSLASAISPVLAGAMFAASPFGWPLVLAGVIKTGYDLLLLRGFRHVKPPEEQD